MAVIKALTLFLLVAHEVNVFERAQLIPQKRSVSVLGGWGLNAINFDTALCPGGSSGCDIGGCCPNTLACTSTGDPVDVVCCPTDADCIDNFLETPVCANTVWTLWNATTQGQYGGFFCCDEGQIGDTTGLCHPDTTILGVSSSAITVVPITPTGISATAYGTLSATATTTSGGIVGKISSIISSSTSKATSGASNTNEPLSNLSNLSNLSTGGRGIDLYTLLARRLIEATRHGPRPIADRHATRVAIRVEVLLDVLSSAAKLDSGVSGDDKGR
ncbi:hypothetical protein G7Y89_g137 [Cudoniella acicularis]|uniref:Uncharacterized protein n=1 Tax=Cudoniella acicularis TaxID=354080 RepID=A0A8H4W8J9_9HELO|nr:hypothetical protein G7Y89_g137 [Cudoniella acicularis]